MSTAITADLSEPQPLHCYRHPERETWVRCGRCDQPICMKCAMDGPVGLRCKTCGKPSRDALASLRPTQIVIAAVLAVGGGAIVGYAGSSFSIFGLVVAFFGGGIIAEVIDRAIGIKRGPRILMIAVPGIVAGGLVGVGLSVLWTWQQMLSYGEEGAPGIFLSAYLMSVLPFALFAVVIAAGVAAARLR
ncbi:MAG TPA: hypothetical protein VK867_06865 [Candidatus Limnocylindrales bacterium]|nr:hypothetical protein [Candidatus Limnocylindrales bacterium]